MMCSTCKAAEEAVPMTRWEKIRYWFFERFFVEEIKSITGEANGRGFIEGYNIGYQHSQDKKTYFTEYVKKLEELVSKKT